MTEHIDHAAEARRILANYKKGGGLHIVAATAAQAHATLALGEQQRIANLIAYHAAGMHKGAIDSPGLPGPHEQARKALGL